MYQALINLIQNDQRKKLNKLKVSNEFGDGTRIDW